MINTPQITTLESELLKFRQHAQYFSSIYPQTLEDKYGCVEDVILWGDKTKNDDKPIDLTIMAIIHGNEVAGVRVLNEVLDVLRLCSTSTPQSALVRFAFVLGNTKAFLQQKRFVNHDLNRCFGTKTIDEGSLEKKRAAEIGKILSLTRWLLDLHQTTEESPSPFFIFPFRSESLRFARVCHAELPIVTHWGESFSTDGQCSDEFVNQNGGHGITIELGQNGFADRCVAPGVRAVLRAIAFAANHQQSIAPKGEDFPTNPEIYTFAQILKRSAQGISTLVPGFKNFSSIKKGQKIAEIDGSEIFSQHDGVILFPFYPRPHEERKPQEICRILRRIDLSEIPA